MDFKNLVIGFLGQLETYEVLLDHKRASHRQLVQVMRRNLVTFSEPMRFAFLFKLNLTIFQLGNLCAVLDVPVKKNELYRNLSYHFNDWSNYSEKCRQGREKFDAEWQRSDPEFSKYILSGIPTFDALLNFVSLLSNKNHKKSREEESEKHMKQSFGNLEDRKEGGGDEDPPSDKDGNKERRKKKDTSSAWFFEAPVMPFHWIDRGSDIVKEYAFYVLKQRWSYTCVKQLIERLISAKAMENDFIPDVDCPSVGFPLVLTCFSNNLFRRDPLKLADDGGEFQSTVQYIDAFLLIIGNPAQTDSHIFTLGSPNNDFTVRQLAELMTEETEFFVLKVDESPYIFGPREGVPWVLACFSENLLRRETWKLADGGNCQRTYVCIKEAIEAPLLMIAHGHVPGEQPLIAVSSTRLYGEGYDDRILDVTLIIKQLVGHISTVGGPSTFTAREFTEMVHGSVSGEPPLEEPLIEASMEQFLGKYDDSNDKRIPGVIPNNKKQLGESPLEDPLIEVSIEQFLGEGYDDSNKRIPDVMLINKQLGWNPNDASPKELLATALTTLQHKTRQTSCRKADVTGSIVELHNMPRSWILRRHC
ncbi:uncharacterized protein [Triticum aestivum]|uniref:uncharacterized protein n=1 Tax=Triticum aestivum TaxID=4565 RepID=UPI00084486E1|nr:uncharacterized protein LOC123071797 [Triticum aestivum]